MNNAVLIQHVYPGLGMECLLDLTEQHHTEYCKAHGFDYWCQRTDTSTLSRGMGDWEKVHLLSIALLDYQYVIWIDADAFIADTQTDLRKACQPDRIGAVQLKAPYTWGDHYNVGALYIENGEWVNEFVRKWLDSYPGPSGQREQGVFNAMAKEGGVFELPPTWNYTVDRHFGIDAPIVRGYHSIRETAGKLSAMKRDLEITRKVTA